MSAMKILTHFMQASPSVIGFSGKEGIYPIKLPERAKPPCFLLNMQGGSDTHMLEGEGGYYLGRISVESMSLDPGVTMDMGDALIAAMKAVPTKTTIPAARDVQGFKDIDVSFADTDVTDTSDNREMSRRILHFYVRWRYLL